MTEGNLPPDRLLRLEAATSLRKHEGVRSALNWFRENPQEFDERIQEFDQVLNSLKSGINLYSMTSLVGINLNSKNEHTNKLAEDLYGHKPLPSIHEMGSISPNTANSDLIQNIKDTFTKVDNLLPTDEWSWATNLNPQQTASGLLIEGYGLMLENHLKIPNLRRNFVLAFEEQLISYFKGSKILKDVIGWMKEEKSSFSQATQKEIEKY